MTIRLLPSPEERGETSSSRRRGRPPVSAGGGEDSTGVYVKLPNADYDKYENQARADGISLPEFIRRRLADQ